MQRKRLGKNQNSIMLELLGAKPIAFNPLLAKLSRKATAGLFMSQLLYWHGKGKFEGWEYHTIKQVQDETGLSRSEQDTAIRIWKGLGVLEVRKFRETPPKRYFKIDTNKLTHLLQKQTDDLRKSTKQFVGNPELIRKIEQYNTESPTENTVKDSFKRFGFNNRADVPNGTSAPQMPF